MAIKLVIPTNQSLKLSKIWVIGLLYIVLALAYTFPLIFELNDSIIGDGGDSSIWIWNGWHFSYRLSQGLNPFYTNHLLTPVGHSLVMNTNMPILGILNILTHNVYLSCNLLLLSSLVLSGIGSFLLSRQFIKSPILCFLTGAIYAFNPFVSAHIIGHLNLCILFLFPFLLLLLSRVGYLHTSVVKPISHKRALFYFGLLFFLAIMIDLVVTFMLGLTLISLIIYHKVEPYISKFSPLKKWSVLLITWLTMHLIIETLQSYGVSNNGAFFNTGNLTGLITPHSSLRLGKTYLSKAVVNYTTIQPSIEHVCFIGISLLLGFAVIFLFKKKEGISYPSLLFLLLWILMISFPKIRLGIHSITFTPTAILHYIPFIQEFRNPTRYFFLFYLIGPILLILSLDRLKVKFKEHLKIAILFIILIEFLPNRFPLQNTKAIKDASYALSKRNKIKSVFYYPTGIIDGHRAYGKFSPIYLQNATVHKKKLIGGYLSRVNNLKFKEFESSLVLKSICSEDSAYMFNLKQWKNFRRQYSTDAMVFNSYSENLEKLIQYLDHLSVPLEVFKSKDGSGFILFK